MPMTASPTIMDWMQSLSDITRARVLRLLERHELTVAELCSVLQLPQSTVSRHLKLLSDDGWIRSRREGTSRYYSMAVDELEPAAQRLWLLLREQTASHSSAEQDDQRLARVLAERQTRSQQFFSSVAGQWDKHRRELFGNRFDLQALPALLSEDWVIGDLGCGTGQVAEALAPFIRGVVAVDNSAAMAEAARHRLAHLPNVEVLEGDLEALPVDDGHLDAAMIYLVLHHLPRPERALAEAARALKPGGRLLVVDMTRHDRREYQQQMGHLWLGFEHERIEAWLLEHGFGEVRLLDLPPDPKAKGPPLFVATARRQEPTPAQ